MRATSFAHSVRCALAGLVWAFRTQRNIRIQSAIAVAVIVTSIAFRLPTMQIATLFLAIAFVIAAELFNTAVEATIDLVSPDVHPLAKIAKDAAAGGVLMAAIGAIVVGVVVLSPPIWSLLLGVDL